MKPPVRPRRGSRHSTVPSVRPPRSAPAAPPPPASVRGRAASRAVARVIDEGDASLLDVIDSLLNKGVVLNADLILSLANVDLVYVRLSALVCAADRLLPPGR
jgi:gas vesicle protein GvpA/GvpJ/GvpM family